MSAICGIIRFNGGAVGSAELESLVGRSGQRGPDGVRRVVEGSVGLAHLAFHVTPESVAERQPLASSDGRLVLVADVRLDNRQELFRKFGIANEELTDPELLLLAYQEWGHDCPRHLLGDFAFAVWDKTRRELFLARDPLGAYGLFYAEAEGSFLFASETAALLGRPGPVPELNETAILKTLASLPMSADETCFRSVRALPPAHVLSLRDGRARVRRYWDIDPAQRIVYRKEGEYADHFEELLERAVECRLRSIHPVGISLSGGNDSTLLAVIAAAKLAESGQRLHSFSYVFDRFPECDERRFIDPVVEMAGIQPHTLPADQLWSFCEESLAEIPDDFFWTNCYSQLPASVARSAGNSGCRVLIDGMFGDALFCEPSLFAADMLADFRWAGLISILRQMPQATERRQELVHRGFRPLIPGALRKAYRRWRPLPHEERFPALTPEKQQRLRELIREEESRGDLPSLPPGRMTRYHRLFQTLWAHGFAATRRNPYNSAGVERLSPYFDRRLVEFVMAIPAEQVSHAASPRRLQKNVMRRRLPDLVWQRSSKADFGPLLSEGLRRSGKKMLSDMTGHSFAVSRDWLRTEWLREALSEFESDDRDDHGISQAIHLELFLTAVRNAYGLG